MRILLLCHSFNSLAQRLHVDLRQAGHDVSVELDIHDDLTREAVALFAPDLVIAPFLKRAIPEDVWRRVRCLIVHPGIRGDRGPHALDRAILDGEPVWGVTLLEARQEMDAGPVWAWREFAMRKARKSSLYRHEVTNAAAACVTEAIARLEAGETEAPMPANWGKGRTRPALTSAERRLDPQAMSAAQALSIIHASDGDPGATIEIGGRVLRIFDAHPAPGLAGSPGSLLGRAGDAIAIAFADHALWICQARTDSGKSLKLPAARLFADRCDGLPELSGPQRIRYRESKGVGVVEFKFYNGAMSSDDCVSLRLALAEARKAALPVLVLLSDADCWSNGIHLGLIENAGSAADESWANINAMNDLVAEIITLDDRLVIAGLLGNAGAGGVFLSLAADQIWMRDGVILNPHYKDMGNLYGSEYWTYLLPARLGAERSRQLTQARLPMGLAEALALGLADAGLEADPEAARAEILRRAEELAASETIHDRIGDKAVRRRRDEATKPLAAYRTEELKKMHRNFYGFDPSYHVARYNFIRKVAKSRTPATLAVHRARPGASRRAGGSGHE